MARRKKSTEEGQLKTDGAVRKKKTKEPRLGANVELRQKAINSTFEHVYALEGRKAAARAQHITPLDEQISKLWQTLKADTGIELADLKLAYKVNARERDAQAMLEEEHGDVVLDNLREIFNALKVGEQLGFLDAVEREPKSDGAPAGDAGADIDRMTIEDAEKLGYEAGKRSEKGEVPADLKASKPLAKAWMRGWQKNVEEWGERLKAKPKGGGSASAADEAGAPLN